MPRCSVLEIEAASKLALEAFGAKNGLLLRWRVLSLMRRLMAM